MAFLKGFGRFWYDFIIGDDWKIAAAVVATLVVTVAGRALGLLGPTSATVFGAIMLMVVFGVNLTLDVRRR
jgi:hypothetical protein